MSRVRLLTKRRVRRAFDQPYITTIGRNEQGIPFVRYQLLPAYIHEHRVNVVYLNAIVKIPSNHFHCINCKLMGGIKTLQEYTCR